MEEKAVRYGGKMAKVLKLIATDIDNRHFESGLIDGKWHGVMRYPELRTICGVQLDGDDGIGATEQREGRVTCPLCRGMLRELQAIKNWE